jgi:Ca2+ transporting ATPase
VKKPLNDESGQNELSSPFLISGSKVIEGYGLMIVCGVGLHSINEKIRQMSGVENEEESTPLQERLENLAELLGKIGLVAGIILALVLLLYTCIGALSNGEWTDDETSDAVSAVIIGITILVVAIPEGLPLALTLSMAYSVIRMKDENIFVRHIRGCEIMGAATNVLTDKTGTLTENKMKITAAVLFEDKINRMDQIRLSKDQTNLLCKAISRNTTAFFKQINGIEEISGSKTEGALIELVKTLGKDLYDYRDIQEELHKFAFNSDSKRMTTVYNLYNEKAEVYTKGAAEVVLDLCKFYFSSNCEILPIDDEKMQEFKRISDSFASRRLRVLALAQKTCPDHLSDQQSDFEQDLVLIGIVGIEDTLRKEAKKSVFQVINSGVIIRMITGDNIDTAVSIAIEAGLIPAESTENELKESVMIGKDFRERSGGLKYIKNDKDEIVEFALNDKEKFFSVIQKMKVLARCSPEDKLLLTVGLKELGEVVAVIGDGSNDSAALKQSDLGIAMMSGTQLAKQSSDIILLDDNFYSVLNSIKWGRNVYACTRKFLQFQLTVNIVALSITIIGGISVRSITITAVQMLWVNLIMDSFAALALATEPPDERLLDSKPFGRTEHIIISDMVITVLSQSVFQITVLMIILFLGPSIFDVDPGWESDDWSEDNAKHFTILFDTFVMFQLFNEINCRKLHMNEVNVFKNFFNNWMFHFIFILTFIVQIVFVQFGGEFMGCSGLNFWQHLACIGIGACALGFGILVRFAVVTYRTRHFKEAKRREHYDEDQSLLKSA